MSAFPHHWPGVTTRHETGKSIAFTFLVLALAACGDAGSTATTLQAAWENLQSDLTAVFTSLQSEDTVDQGRVEEIVQDFQNELEAAGEEVGPELRQAWELLREHIDRLVA